MVKLTPEQLASSPPVAPCYLLAGNALLLIEESRRQLIEQAKQRGFNEQYAVNIDQQTDWQEIFQYSQALSLFANQKIIILNFSSLPNANQQQQLSQLFSLLVDDLLLIITLPSNLSTKQQQASWFKSLTNNTVYIQCQTPEAAQLRQWLKRRAKQHSLQLEEVAAEYLCHCYEGNLLALAQIIDQLELLYGQQVITVARVEEIVSQAALFTPYHWLDSLLSGKFAKAHYILQQLLSADTEVVILLRSLQKDLLLLWQLQSSELPLRQQFDQLNIWQNRRPLLSQALQRLNQTAVMSAIQQLAQIEIQVKQDYQPPLMTVWQQLMITLCQPAANHAIFNHADH